VKLEDLIDLEVQIAADRDKEPETLRARDRSIYQSLDQGTFFDSRRAGGGRRRNKIGPTRAGDPASDSGTTEPARPQAALHKRLKNKHELLTTWLAVLRANHGGADVGRAFVRGQRILSYILVVVGLAVGWTTAALLLDVKDGQEPVNLLWFMAVTIGGQLVLLVLLLLSQVLLRLAPNLPVLDDLHEALRLVLATLQRIVLRGAGGQKAREQFKAAAARLRMRASLYKPVERWLLLATTQSFAIAFNIGVIACCIRLILFTDLAFAWGTTVTSIDTDGIHKATSWLSKAWSWLVPSAVPSPELITETQYFRLESRFTEAPAGTRGNPELVGDWWRFMMAAVVTYGLLPRLVLGVAARLGLAWSLMRLPLGSADITAILRRMAAPTVQVTGDAGGADGAEPARAVASRAVRPEDVGPASVVLWRDIPVDEAWVNRALARGFGGNLARLLRAGGADFLADRAVSEELAVHTDPIFIVAEAWEPPDKSIRRFLRFIREAAGKQRPITVALVGRGQQGRFTVPDGSDMALWRDRLTLLEDPYIGTAALEDVA